jgi:hypothetical protein
MSLHLAPALEALAAEPARTAGHRAVVRAIRGVDDGVRVEQVLGPEGRGRAVREVAPIIP